MTDAASQILGLAEQWGPVQFLVVAMVLGIMLAFGGSLYANWRLVLALLRISERMLAIKIQLRDALRALRKAVTGGA